MLEKVVHIVTTPRSLAMLGAFQLCLKEGISIAQLITSICGIGLRLQYVMTISFPFGCTCEHMRDTSLWNGADVCCVIEIIIAPCDMLSFVEVVETHKMIILLPFSCK